MTLLAFLSAVLALLLAPGPTNTLIGLAGVRSGLRGAARLLPAELAGYLTTILPLAWVGARFLDRFPHLAPGLKLAAALWIMLLAFRIWRNATTNAPPDITLRRVYITTVLNPKALVFGLVLLPPMGQPDFLPRLALFCLMATAVALIWAAAGAATRLAPNEARLILLHRLAAAWLAVLSLGLIIGVLLG